MMKFIFMLVFLIPILNNYWLVMHLCLFMSFLFLFFTEYFNFVTLTCGGFGLDTLSYSLIGLTYFICSMMFISSYKIYIYKEKILLFSLLVLLLMIFLLLTFSSLNMLVFYIFFECSLIPTLFLIFGWGYQPERIMAGYYLMFYTLFASFPLLLGIFYVYNISGSLDFWLILMDECPFYLYVSMILAFLFKMPIPFFHFWLPKAHVEAPVSGSMILAAILLKLGGYGLIRVYLFIGDYALKFNYFWISLSLLGSLLVSFLCLFQIDMKSVIAYSSVAHMSIVICGIMSYSYYGFLGSLIMMIGHGLCSSALFCLANFVYERSHSRSLLINKGYMISMPGLTFFWFMLCSNNMSSPPSLNLLGEIYLINSLISWSSMSFLFIFFVSFMSCCYSVYLFSSMQHGTLSSNLSLSYSVSIREYLLIMLHLIPLNFLILKFNAFTMFL